MFQCRGASRDVTLRGYLQRSACSPNISAKRLVRKAVLEGLAANPLASHSGEYAHALCARLSAESSVSAGGAPVRRRVMTASAVLTDEAGPAGRPTAESQLAGLAHLQQIAGEQSTR